jgi:hypothetical protein
VPRPKIARARATPSRNYLKEPRKTIGTPHALMVYMPGHGLLPTLAFIVVGLSAFSFCQQPPSELLPFIVQKLEQTQRMQPSSAYAVIREYRLFGSDSSRPSSEVTAELNYRPPNLKTYAIEKRTGSSRGEQVVKRILDHEVEMTGRNSLAALLTSRNYNFTYLGERADFGNRYFLLGLQPRRKDKNLLSGTAWVDENSFLVRHIEGELAQSPSWWIKTVHVSIDFAHVAGAWQQTRMKAVADVRFIGIQTLQSQTIASDDTMLAQASSQRQHRARSVPAELLLVSPDGRH